jgi:hypothetical protein
MPEYSGRDLFNSHPGCGGRVSCAPLSPDLSPALILDHICLLKRSVCRTPPLGRSTLPVLSAGHQNLYLHSSCAGPIPVGAIIGHAHMRVCRRGRPVSMNGFAVGGLTNGSHRLSTWKALLDRLTHKTSSACPHVELPQNVTPVPPISRSN